MSKFLCSCGFYVGEEQFCMTGTEDGHVVFYSISSEKAAMISCGDASEIVLGLDALPHGDVAVGMMGSENQVLIFSPYFVCFS